MQERGFTGYILLTLTTQRYTANYQPKIVTKHTI